MCTWRRVGAEVPSTRCLHVAEGQVLVRVGWHDTLGQRLCKRPLQVTADVVAVERGRGDCGGGSGNDGRRRDDVLGNS